MPRCSTRKFRKSMKRSRTATVTKQVKTIVRRSFKGRKSDNRYDANIYDSKIAFNERCSNRYQEEGACCIETPGQRKFPGEYCKDYGLYCLPEVPDEPRDLGFCRPTTDERVKEAMARDQEGKDMEKRKGKICACDCGPPKKDGTRDSCYCSCRYQEIFWENYPGLRKATFDSNNWGFRSRTYARKEPNRPYVIPSDD